MKILTNQKLLFKAAFLVAIAFTTASAFAHRLNVFAYTEGNEIVVESSFAGGSGARSADVSIRNKEGNTVFEGKTDEQGIARFAIPSGFAPQDLSIIVSAGEGHQNHWELAKSDFPGVQTAPANPVKEVNPVNEKHPLPVEKAIYTQAQMDLAVAQARDEMERTVAAPLRRQLAQSMQPEITFKDIMGGIGWLVGIAGILAWFSSRRRRS